MNPLPPDPPSSFLVDVPCRQLWPLTLKAACLQGTAPFRLPGPGLKPMKGHVGRPEALSCIKVGPLVWQDSCSGPGPLPAEQHPPHPRCSATRASLNNPFAPESSSQAQLLGNWVQGVRGAHTHTERCVCGCALVSVCAPLCILCVRVCACTRV